MKRKGQVGLETGKAVIIAILVIAVIIFAMLITLQSLRDSEVSKTSSSAVTQTETAVTVLNSQDLSISDRADCSVTGFTPVNQTGGEAISSGNYTLTGCTINAVASSTYNNTAWNFTYTYQYNAFANPSENLSVAVADFTSNSGTWFSLLAVSVIILIVALVIVAVNRFSGSRGNLL